MKLAPAAVAIIALAAFALAAQGDPQPAVVRAFLPGKAFGLGEMHVYVVERSETIAVRYRGDSGDVVTRTLTRDDKRSVAFTVEGYGDGGAAVLALSDTGAQTTDSAASAADEGAPLPTSSPIVGADGNVAASGPLRDLALSWLAFDGIDQPLADGVKWKGSGDIELPLGRISSRLWNVATAWNGDPGVFAVASNGDGDVLGSVRVPGFGDSALHGRATISGQSFVDVRDQLLLGATYAVDSRGNAAGSRSDVGTYTLSARSTVKLVRFAAGLAPWMPGPFPSGPIGLSRSADISSDIIRSANSREVTRPAPTDNVFTETPLPVASPTAGPDVSLPPVPLPISSDAPFASPPAPPPTPMPTRTPR